jgi:hypothetical protein
MKNLTKFEDFVLEGNEIGDDPLQNHLKAQKDFNQKIGDLTGKLKKALDTKDSDPKEVNKMKLALRILNLEKELEDANYKMSEIE